MAVSMAGGSRVKEAINSPSLPVAPETGRSTDEDLAALAQELEDSPPPTKPARSRSTTKRASESVATESKLPSYDDLDESDADLQEKSLDDADDTEAVDDDGDIDDQERRQQIADAYGIDVSELEGFSTPEDAEKALAFADQRFMRGMQQHSGQQWQQPPQQPTQQQPSPQQVAAQLKEIELELEEWQADEPLRKNFAAIKGAINPMVQEMAFLRQALVVMYQGQVEREQQQREQTFHSTLDRLNPELFGTSEKMSPLQRKNRERVAEQFDILEAGHYQRFGNAPPMPALIDRVVKAHFAAQLAKEKRNQQAANGNGRPKLGKPGRGRSRKDNGGALDYDGPIEDNPALHRLYQEMVEAGGEG